MVFNAVSKCLSPNLLLTVNRFNKNVVFQKSIFKWLNIIFNQVDKERLKIVGPDRVCAEWLLRNGAAVKWAGADRYLYDYNSLPSTEYKFKLTEVDGSDSSIAHYGFPHFIDCDQIFKVILHNCIYVEDDALKYLKFLKHSLTELQISSCGNISDRGLRHLKTLSNLKNLVMFDLSAVQGKKELLMELQAHLPECHMCFDEFEGTYFNEKYKFRKCRPVEKKKIPEITLHLPSKPFKNL